MAFFIPHDLFEYMLSFKDPRYELVRGGGKTPSAQCMPFNSETNFQDLRDPWDLNTLMMWDRSAIEHHGIGQSPFDPSHITGGSRRQIVIYSLNAKIEIVFYTGRHLNEIREGRRREELRLDQRRREEISQFWENHHARWGTTTGQEYL